MRTISLLSLFSILLLWVGHVSAQQKQIYIALDNHTDYYWSGNAAAYDSVAVREIDFYLDLVDSTLMLDLPYQNRYNLDGAWYVEAYRRQKSSAEFNRLISRIKSGHISVPYNYLVSTYGGQPTEAVLRGMYWSGKLERTFNLDIKLASSMENHTQPLGLGSLWAGAGAKYSWKGVCGCDTPVSPTAMANRTHEIYRYQGLDSMGVLMKWYSLNAPHPDELTLGTYAEASRLVPAVNQLVDKCNSPAYPYRIAGAFGTGADELETLYDYYPSLAIFLSNDERQIYLSNEYDFFEHFESEYDTRQLPAETVTYGNDWDTGCTALAAPTANIRRAVEKLRSAEALAALATIADTSFYERFDALREQTWIALGSYWEHGFLGGGCCLAERGPWAIGLQEQVSRYVDSLHRTALNALSVQIANPDSSARFFVFNPLGQVRTDYADIPYPFGSTDIRIVEVAGGAEVPHQVFSDGESNYLRILAADVPATGYKVYELQLEPGADWPAAATLEGDVFENDFYSLTVTPGGAITSLIDKVNGQTEYVQAINGRYLNDFGQGAGFDGTLQLLNSGPVSATIACTSPLPLPHTTLITLYRDINRIDILNRINGEFGDSVRTYSFSFDLGGAPSTWHEELGAVIQAKYTTNGGHYAPPGQPIRHQWQTLNHFADIGADAKGVTLSNLGAAFMKLGNSDVDFLDEDASQINVLIGGKIYGAGFENQLGATEFENAFSLRTRATSFSAVESMKFALEHQNPLIAAPVGNEAGTLPDSSFSLLRIDNPNVLLWTLKPAEEESDQRGIVLRFWNLARQAEEYTADFAYQVLDARQATHLETDIGSAPVEQGNLRLQTGQQKMETYRVFLSSDISCASNILVQANICPGESFEGYTMSGTYVDTFALTGGCDSIRTLVLEVASEVPDTLNRSICQGESFEGYSMSGAYTDTLTTAAGCDSVRILILEVLPGTTGSISETICQGESFEGYTISGTYTDTLTAANGCDSIRTLVLEVLPEAADSIDQTICQGESFEGYTISGTYIDTLTAANGCDSLRTIVLEVLPAAANTIDQTICQGESFEGYTMSGSYTDTLTAANGCDSVRTIMLEVLPEAADSINQTICQGESFEGYTMSGTYIDTLTAANGCDSVRTIVLEVLPGTTGAISQTICQGESFEGYTMSGTYIDTLTAANGCDSLRTLVLEVLPGAANTISETICPGESFEGYTMSGTYIDTLTAANGCDSLRTLVLEVLPAIDTVHVMFTTCDLSAVGTQTVTLMAANGCDSTVVYTTTYVPFLLNLELTPATPGMSDGTATAMLSGGTPPFTYLWSTGATGASISGLAPGLYSLTVSDADGCTVVSSFEVLQASSVESLATLLSMKVYPNPVSERLMLELNFEKAERGMCLLYDYLGRVVHREAFYGNVIHTEINSRRLPDGIYLLSVLFSDQQATRRIVVQHR